MILAAIETITGFVVLLLAGDALVRGAAAIAERLRIPPLVIGLTVVAFGTSLPELFVSIGAVLADAPALALGNVVGSNIANIWLVLGIPALISPLACRAMRIKRNLAAMLVASILLIALSIDGAIDLLDGLFLLAGLTLFLGWSWNDARRHPEAAREFMEFEEELGISRLQQGRAVLLVLLGLAGLAFGAHLLIDGAVALARAFGVAEAVIGLTVVAIGTSLPELITCAMAAWRRHDDLAIGNVIGSNLFNILAILGISSLVGTIPVPIAFRQIDFWVMLAASTMLIPHALRRRPIGRGSGLLFLSCYLLYIAWLAHDGRSLAYMTGALMP